MTNSNKAEKILQEVITTKLTKSEKVVLEHLLTALLNDSKELEELKNSDLANELLEQKKITKIWIDKCQDLKRKRKNFVSKDPYLSARGERLDW
jgi:hypothetical protein